MSHPPDERYAVIGAGPMGLAAARNLQRFGIPFQGFELHADVGGLWDMDNPHSTMYESAHLISSKRTTEFKEYPMGREVADYPSHRELKRYFQGFAEEFGLREHYRFGTRVVKVERPDGAGASAASATATEDGGDGNGRQGWLVTSRNEETGEEVTEHYKGVLIANGTLHEPNIPSFAGEFTGEIFHSAEYQSPEVFAGKRVLVIGAGNSGCDIVVDAVHHGTVSDISVRRGYHFVPKYVFGVPADTVGRLPLPHWLKKRIDKVLLRWFTGDPVRFGFPEPDHDLYESHPIVNSLVLYHLGHGDVRVQPDIDRFEGKTVVFKDGSREDYDVVVLATGYKLHFPFIDDAELNWSPEGACPNLYLNCFHPRRDDLFVMGMVEAAGLGWEGRYEQAELVARYIRGLESGAAGARRFQRLKSGDFPDMRGGVDYIQLDRMAYYVHKDTYRKTVRKHLKELS